MVPSQAFRENLNKKIFLVHQRVKNKNPSATGVNKLENKVIGIR
jgi:hypothetical protein